MDVPGWHAQRRAERENDLFYTPYRADGQYHPVEQVGPMDEKFIGGFHNRTPGTPPPPILPPKDYVYQQSGGHVPVSTQSSISSAQLTQYSAVERSQILRVARMKPHLQVFDTVDQQGIWHGAALIVTADSGSVYEPYPLFTYKWDPDAHGQSPSRTGHRRGTTSFDLGPHPADPHSTTLPLATTGLPQNGFAANGVILASEVKRCLGKKSGCMGDQAGATFTFWRFPIHVPLVNHEMPITYTINKGQALEWATYSCNGFSAGVNQDDFRGPGFKSGYDPVWTDLLAKHMETPFHVLVGGGDQLYCDRWLKMKPEQKKKHELTREIGSAIDRFYFNHYCQTFRTGAFARATVQCMCASIPSILSPMMNMAGASNPISCIIIDGFGSYPADLQLAPVFKAIDAVDGTQDSPGMNINQSLIIGGPGPYVPFPSHSFLSYLGPQTYILLLDCSERKKEQVCSQLEYDKVFQRLQQMPPEVEHLVVQLGIPIAYPRMVFLEAALESKFNPLTALGRSGSWAELLDDLNDHWTARSHKRERNAFIQQLQSFALSKRIRITFLSGDVHCAAVGVLKSLKLKNQPEIPPAADHRYMLNIVSSKCIDGSPLPNPVISMVSSLATKVHKTLHHMETDETMMPVFLKDTNGTPRKQKFIMGRRNWCQVEWESATGDLIFDIRVEKEKGLGETVGYAVRVPPPRWQRRL
ncbi:hypothetical protein BD779DRAFT_1502479 [Infundibulicybe gibba]|nr:hypothetical protein BD779DRAFT_1502479 [Infundibulicybe gibba]